MKLKHNKKRNTAFLYEVLIKEYTKAVVRKDNKLKRQPVTVLGFAEMEQEVEYYLVSVHTLNNTTNSAANA